MLFLIYKPPPLHGAALNGRQLTTYYSSENHTHINIGLSRSSREIGKYSLKKLTLIGRILFEILKEMRLRHHAKIYFSHTIRKAGFFRDLFLIIGIKLFFPKVRIVYHIHNCSNRIDSNSNWLNHLLYSSAQVIYLSESFYSSSFPVNTRLYTLPNYSEFTVPIRSNLCSYSLICVANFDHFKGIYTLLQAVKKLLEVTSQYHLSLVGAEGDISLEELNNYIESIGIKSNVTIYHKISHSDVQKLLLRSSIMILVSEDEAMPMSLIEGCSLGLALISTDVGATKEIVMENYNGYLIDKSIEAIVEKVIHYKYQPELLQIHSINSIRLAEEKFNKREYFKKLDKILNE